MRFGAARKHLSFGRTNPAGQPEFWPRVTRTFGTANGAPVIGSVLINEVITTRRTSAAADNVSDEFIELHNPTTTAIELGGCRIKGGTADIPFRRDRAPSRRLRARVGFDPADTVALNAFRSTFAIPASVPIYGPYSSKLANSTADVEIAYPAAPVAGVTPYINVDKVAYADSAPWPGAADGNGPSLQRQSRTVIGNDPANWVAAQPTPGRENSGQTAITDNDGDGIPNAWEDLYGLDKFNAADALLDAMATARATSPSTSPAPRQRIAPTASKRKSTAPASGPATPFASGQSGKAYTIRYKNSPDGFRVDQAVDIRTRSGAARRAHRPDHGAVSGSTRSSPRSDRGQHPPAVVGRRAAA